MVDDSVATVFRQVAMNRFEDACHTERRNVGELSVERFGELWIESQTDMMGDSVELTDNYASWWSYIPHFIGSPGYVYAYAYGQLLALSVYARYEERGEEFVPAYLDLLRAGGRCLLKTSAPSWTAIWPIRRSGLPARHRRPAAGQDVRRLRRRPASSESRPVRVASSNQWRLLHSARRWPSL